MFTPTPVVVLALVYLLTAVRRIGSIRLQIWQVMLAGALAVILTGSITLADAAEAVNADVMLFLFGMFVVGRALEESGYLSHVSYRIFRGVETTGQLVAAILIVMGLLSAFLMNDTLAIIGTPLVILLARKHSVEPKVLLITLAFAVTIGSAMSPIGNPQNLLVAVNGGVKNPFVTFLKHLLLPTILNLALAYVMLKVFYGKRFNGNKLNHSDEPVKDKSLAKLSKASLAAVVALVSAKIALALAGVQFDFKLTYIALIPAALILVLSPMRLGVLKRMDWHTLVFFAAMFVLMESVWDSGFFQAVINGAHADLSSIPAIMAVSVILSQFISNVPLVALYLPMLAHAGVSEKGLVALAAGSTIAGNLTILGAASNVIIIQNAEGKAGETVSFMEFARIGVPLTAVNVLVYWLLLQ